MYKKVVYRSLLCTDMKNEYYYFDAKNVNKTISNLVGVKNALEMSDVRRNITHKY